MKLQLTLFVLFWTACIFGESILSITLNKEEGQIYALSSAFWMYELDNVHVSQNNFHFLNSSASPSFSSAFIKKINGQKYVFQGLSDFNNYGALIGRFKLPFGNRPTLTPTETSQAYGYTPVPTFFDNVDSLALTISNGDRLSLVDLVAFNLSQETRIIQGNKRAATAVLYNYKTDKAVVFWYTFAQSTRTYRLNVLEYNVINRASFSEATSTFPDTTNDFNNTRATNAAFDSINNKYYILDEKTKRLVRFNSNNLANYAFIPLGAISFDSGNSVAVYDFDSQVAYVISYVYPTGFKLQKVNLVTQTITRTESYDTGGSAATTAYLDVEQGNLYVGLLHEELNSAAKISVIDLGNFNQQIITFTH